jgi:hypothetical protein
MADITISDALLVAAAITGPVLAVQAQKWIERVSEKKREKTQIFSTLMTTRATRLAPEHVQALNKIELAFDGGSPKDVAVVDAWRLYADNLNSKPGDDPSLVTAWLNRGDDLFVDLLAALSKALGYKFDKVHLRRGIYYPIGHFEIEATLRSIQSGLASPCFRARAPCQ